MNALNLSDDDFNLIIQLIKTHLPDAIIWAYGSRVKGKSHIGSDLDVVVLNKTNDTLPSEGLQQLRQALEESDLPMLIDIHDWAYLPKSFKDEIEKNKVILWEPELN